MACRKAGLAARRGTLDLSALRGVGSTGAPLPAAGFHWVRDAVSAGDPARVAERRHRPLHRLPRARRRSSRSGRARSAAGCWARRSRRSTRPGGRSSGARASSSSPRRCRRCRSRSGATPTARGMRAAYFETLPGRLAPRRLDHDHRARLVRHHAAAATRRSTAAACASGRPSSTASSRRCRRSPTASSSTSRTPGGGPGELLLFVVLRATAGRSTTRCARGSPPTLRTELSPRHVPDAIIAVPAVPRTLSGKKLEVPVKRILLGTPPDDAASRDALADRRSLEPFEAFAAERASGQPPAVRARAARAARDV